MARWFSKSQEPAVDPSTLDPEVPERKPPRWSLGIMQDRETDEVPGSVLLLSKVAKRNEPLGLRNAPARTSASSLPSPYPSSIRSASTSHDKKRTDGGIILEPQPEESQNDPLNWSSFRRDAALISLGFYCMIGGGMTPVLAAGFNNVAETYNVEVTKVALTTGLYMMGIGVGCVIASPTAILYGKRPVYLTACVIFILTAVWCALSPNYPSLLIARIVQGIAISPVECLPSATIAEIFFLHERAYRLGVYTLLLLGGKNLVPLVSAAIIESLDWRWVFWVVAIVAGFGGILLFFFVPETFWSRTPRPRHKSHKSSSAGHSRIHLPHFLGKSREGSRVQLDGAASKSSLPITMPSAPGSLAQRRRSSAHAHFAVDDPEKDAEKGAEEYADDSEKDVEKTLEKQAEDSANGETDAPEIQVIPAPNASAMSSPKSKAAHDDAWKVEPKGGAPKTPFLHNINSPYYASKMEEQEQDYFSVSPSNQDEEHHADHSIDQAAHEGHDPHFIPHIRSALKSPRSGTQSPNHVSRHVVLSPPLSAKASSSHLDIDASNPGAICNYTEHFREAPKKTYSQTLKFYSGRLSHDKWFRVALRPFILFAYPAVLWSTVVYSLSIGWLIVLSESVSAIYRNRETYNFTALQCGLVYISPFVGGVLGTAVAGKCSDIVVRYMSRRNDGVYEPEFRLVMAVPVALCTAIGLMGFGWSAEERDAWIVPTIFFGVVSFGCSLGSTTSITFCVDSYRQYAGEALVTLNFSKNVFHGLVFSLFFTEWLESDGAKTVFVIIGCIQIFFLLFSIPMYIYGKRARMWTVRKNLMEKF
ncbi:uncharacterized protein K452DRAFT_294871 [Aplosporella prunicola CBS 121167]|uniref:Major facilitator superfamily (MFS) profile domain-containing protein n=1 Tax=Aplosporella prunicola CBS 121167 TaxID=1176127 RepID=A0A6A6BSQ5_9PEZI|nr:uncharacterized protein K452DRAFT_294871 [Aplosporella prunicola CBS 121167]KAF2146295.1 hypothetical protein K452DRAFT_294871 [Aplosporella prunicola CBS 121167]